MENLEIEIDQIVRNIRCPECGDSFNLSDDTSSKPASKEVKPEKSACTEFRRVLNEKITHVRDGASISEFRLWAQRYSI